MPVPGPESLGFLKRVVPAESRSKISRAAASILGKGASPLAESDAGSVLVVGHIQSGKTMSFEMVTALAKDNGIQIVVVIAGSANPLLDQSAGRLYRDLGLGDAATSRGWILLSNPGPDASTEQTIRDVLGDWRDPETPAQYRKTVLITVLKHHSRLQRLTELLLKVGMRRVPVLIIDDEADQASLNNAVARGSESSTYRFLMGLRQALPNHTFLQYTATPQAPLLISIVDALSPRSVSLLEPGPDYVGGLEFFGGSRRYLRVIPPGDVPTKSNPLSAPPQSLLHALRVFMVGVTAGFLESGNRGNRSMLVHPSHLTEHHEEYCKWVRDIFEEWKGVLGLPEASAARKRLIASFQEAYDDVRATASATLPPFVKLIASFRIAFRHTRVLEVNGRAARQTPKVDWGGAYGWILVGGKAVDRGFTVEGLTVTYMPRGIGVGNADTMQQRARFFGYKRKYLAYCRVYLEEPTLRAFEAYVEHEIDIRAQLEAYETSGRPLSEWKRAFVLERRLQPCRRSVLEFDYMRGSKPDAWVAPQVLLAPPGVVESNRQVVSAFLQTIRFEPDSGSPRRKAHQKHLVCRGVPLRKVLEELLVNVRITGTADSQRNTAMLLQLSKALEENPRLTCAVYQMSSGTARRRAISKEGRIASNLFQGPDPTRPPTRVGKIYPGDRAIRSEHEVSVQIHSLALAKGGKIVAQAVPVIAVLLPGRISRPWLVQDQPLQAGLGRSADR